MSRVRLQVVGLLLVVLLVRQLLVRLAVRLLGVAVRLLLAMLVPHPAGASRQVAARPAADRHPVETSTLGALQLQAWRCWRLWALLALALALQGRPIPHLVLLALALALALSSLRKWWKRANQMRPT